MSEFHGVRDIKATRKAHVCEQCNTYIDVGSPARYSAGKWDGEFYTTHTHVECHAAALEYARLNDLWGEEWPWFQHMEDSEYEHHAWLLEHHPIVATRLSIKANQPMEDA